MDQTVEHFDNDNLIYNSRGWQELKLINLLGLRMLYFLSLDHALGASGDLSIYIEKYRSHKSARRN